MIAFQFLTYDVFTFFSILSNYKFTLMKRIDIVLRNVTLPQKFHNTRKQPQNIEHVAHFGIIIIIMRRKK